ncbi:MAG: endonuclease [Gemmatimonadales bacterium]|nr:endonuclease [Gemmatimonadales bacterium]
MTDLERLTLIVQALLANRSTPPSAADIRAEIAEVRPLCLGVTDEQADALALEFETRYVISIRPAAALQDPFTPWLDRERPTIDPYYWTRYRDLLRDKGFPRQVLAELDRDTDRIVGFLENPKKPGVWDRRGMVIGHVQSGKTANYIGVANKAADAGYRVIIIIAGIQNKLRDQTQRRVDEGLIGFDTAAGIQSTGRPPLGVGGYDRRRQPISFTTATRDFNRAFAESLSVRLQDLGEPVVLVIKKNPHTLRNLIDWLQTHNARIGTDTIAEPMLLLDDEADNASINIDQRMDEISTINGLLRRLLTLFERSCYVGYTATPFANIFIDPDDEDDMVGDDLFPRDFIVCLNAPSNYYGPERVFGDSGSTVVRDVDDHRDLLPMSHSKEHVVTELPGSLLDAIRLFLVARAIRLVRGQRGAHNSMLVNASRFVAVQRQIRNEIHDRVRQIESSCRINAGRPVEAALQDPELAALHRVFRELYEGAVDQEWEVVQRQLYESVSPVRVMEINMRSADALNYDDYSDVGLNVIAVGGMSLSRGLTLEGLTVSYVLRRSLMYDTLFQMGRWFGYRDGYEDLCRVWLPQEAQGWYEHIAESNDELREELVRMERIDATPRDFGLKVRSHPDALMVTARNKLGSSRIHKVRIGLGSQFVETTILHRDSQSLDVNRQAATGLVDRLKERGLAPQLGTEEGGGRLVRNVPVQLVDRFLAVFKNHPGSFMTEPEPVRRYIADRPAELSHWDVLFAGVKRETSKSLITELLGFRLVCQRREDGRPEDESMVMVTKKQRVASRGVERVGLTAEQRATAERKYRRSNPGIENRPDRIYRMERTTPLLIIHLLAIGEKDEDLSNELPFVAWSLSLPKTSRPEQTVEYVVNRTWLQEQYGDDDADDDPDE